MQVPVQGPMYVLMSSVLMSAFVVDWGQAYLTTPLTSSPLSHREREILDCAVITFRAWWASAHLGIHCMPLEQLVFGKAPTRQSYQLEYAVIEQLVGRHVLLPLGDAEREPRVVTSRVGKQLDLAQFLLLLHKWLDDPTAPFAYYGPGNYKADAWLFFKQPDTGRPLVIFTSSKQRAGGSPEWVDASGIMTEMRKDVFGYAAGANAAHFDFLYVYITDQRVRSVPADGHVVVIPPQLHGLYYNSLAQLLELMKSR